jgi:ankyrin repeat protein
MLKHFKKYFLLFSSFSLLLPMYAMENRDTHSSNSSNMYAALATRIFPLLTTFLFYKYKQYKTNIEFGRAVCNFLLNNNQEENFQTIRKCIRNGADPDYKMEQNKATGLMLTAVFSNKTLFKYLIENGADVNPGPCNGLTPFYYLISGLQENPERFDAEMFEYLLKHTNPKPIKTSSGSETPLSFMCRIKNSNLIKLFIKYGLDVNENDCLGKLPLVYAMKFKNIEAIKEFCHAGALIPLFSGDGGTIFHGAALAKFPKKYIRALITHTRFDSYDKDQKAKERKVLAVLSIFPPWFPPDLRFSILEKLTLVDDDYCSNKKLCKKLFSKGFKIHIINQIGKRVKEIDTILRTTNNEGRTALDLLYASQDNQYIQEVEPLFTNRQLKKDFIDFANTSQISEDNLIDEMAYNCIQVLKED